MDGTNGTLFLDQHYPHSVSAYSESVLQHSYIATFNTSYQLVPFTFAVREGSVRDVAGHSNVVLPNQTCTQVFDWTRPEPRVVVEPISFGTSSVECHIEPSDNVVIEHVAYVVFENVTLIIHLLISHFYHSLECTNTGTVLQHHLPWVLRRAT